MKKRKVAVSACLLGELCRYDGTTKQNDGVIEAFKNADIIPFCPEAPAFGTPRERISVILSEEVCRVIGDESGRDVTALIEEQTRQFIDAHHDLDAIVLKSKSPSCGLGTTPMLNGKRGLVGYGDGVAAAMLRKAFGDIEIVDEHAYHSVFDKVLTRIQVKIEP